ncbi:MAG: hypothetical protein ACRDK3_00490 [Actinomycetota bacterium]
MSEQAIEQQQEWSPSPARGYAWEPFQQGHTLSQKSGYWSDRRIGPLADEVLDSLLAAIREAGATYLLNPVFRYALRRTAVAIARLENEETYLSDHPADETSMARRDKAEGSVKWWLAQMGLTGGSAAKVRSALSSAAADQANVVTAFAQAARERSRQLPGDANSATDDHPNPENESD